MRRVALIVALTAALAAPSSGDTLPAGMTGSAFTYTVVAGDSLTRLAARFGVSALTLARINRLPPKSVLHPGQQLIVDNRHITLADAAAPLVLNVAQRMLFLRDGATVAAYPIAVGRSGWETPTGPFTIVDKEPDPAWDVPVSIQHEMRQQGLPVQTRVPPGPGNPLGRYFVRLSFPGVGIHGTNLPSSIYTFTTHGCIRMNAADIAAVYQRVQVRMRGASVYEPVLMLSDEGRVLLEVHPDPYRRASPPMRKARQLAAALGVSEAIDWGLAAEAVRRQAGIATDVSRAP